MLIKNLRLLNADDESLEYKNKMVNIKKKKKSQRFRNCMKGFGHLEIFKNLYKSLKIYNNNV